jgi:hypothetical protein
VPGKTTIVYNMVLGARLRGQTGKCIFLTLASTCIYQTGYDLKNSSSKHNQAANDYTIKFNHFENSIKFTHRFSDISSGCGCHPSNVLSLV